MNGFICAATDGCADDIDAELRPGSYVLPAWLVAAMGRGNSLAGAIVLQTIFFPQPPATNGRAGKLSRGAISGGEYVIAPEIVRALGDGDISLGHDRLDQWVIAVRNAFVVWLETRQPSP